MDNDQVGKGGCVVLTGLTKNVRGFEHEGKCEVQGKDIQPQQLHQHAEFKAS